MNKNKPQHNHNSSIIERLINYLKSIDYPENFRSLLWAAVIALIIRTFFFEPFRIPSTSMLPTMRIGDLFFTSKYDYGYSLYSLPIGFDWYDGRIFSKPIPRGDIVVFKINSSSPYYIKRVVGIPGDKIQMKRGVLYINDKPCEMHYAGVYKEFGKYGEATIYNKFIEEMPDGANHFVLDANVNNHRDFPDNTDEFFVPERHYFMMGDNRNNSRDSRYMGGAGEMGFIPERNIVGKAYFMFWTSDFTFTQLWNDFTNSRVFKLIHENQML